MKKVCKGLLICFLCIFLCGCDKETQLAPNEEKATNGIELYPEENVNLWLKENYKFLNLAFRNCSKPVAEEKIIYETVEQKNQVLFPYLSLIKPELVNDGKVKKQDFIEISSKLFESSSDVKEEEITIPISTGFGIFLPVFWKFEKTNQDTYILYLVDFACAMSKEENTSFIYSPGTALKLEDLKKYNPGVIEIEWKKKNDNFIILSSKFTENYSFN